MGFIPKSARLLRQQTRSIHTTPAHRYQHVLFLGNLLGYQSINRLSGFPRAWLDSVGVSADVDHGLRWSGAGASPSHALMSYTLLESALDGSKPPRKVSEELSTTGSDSHSSSSAHAEADEAAEREGVVLQESGEEYRKEHGRGGVSKVFGIGRNTHAQLGLGFSSQEATRGMVTGQIEGSGGVERVVAGSGFSFVVTSTSSSASLVYGFGNDTRGQLGSSSPSSAAASSSADAYDISTRLPGSEAPQLKLLPLPKSINIDANDSEAAQSGDQASAWKVKDLAGGLDHSLMLVERELNGYRLQQVLSTGLNTDGQLGLTPSKNKDRVPIEPLISPHFQPVPLHLKPVPITLPQGEAEEVVSVVAGADTSYALTRAGGMWVWGNSEYGQSFAGIQDRIPTPILLANPLPAAYSAFKLSLSSSQTEPSISKIVAGGAYAALLDTNGRVWISGFLPTSSAGEEEGLPPKNPQEWAKLRLVSGFPHDAVVEDLFSGLEYLVAITRNKDEHIAVWIWGIPPRSISTLPIEKPTQVPWSIPRTPREKYLDENPTIRAKLDKENKGAEQVKASVKVEHVACTRDHVLVVLQDGKSEKGVAGMEVWAESIGPPRGKSTDVTL